MPSNSAVHALTLLYFTSSVEVGYRLGLLYYRQLGVWGKYRGKYYLSGRDNTDMKVIKLIVIPWKDEEDGPTPGWAPSYLVLNKLALSFLVHTVHAGSKLSCTVHAGSKLSCTVHAGSRLSCTFHAGSKLSCTVHAGPKFSCAVHAGAKLSCTFHAGSKLSCTAHACCKLSCTAHACCKLSCTVCIGSAFLDLTGWL